MSECSGGIYPAIVKLGYSGRIKSRWERQWFADKTVLESRDELGLPVQSLNLPCSQREGGDGNERQRYDAESCCLLASTDVLCRPVE